MNSSHERMLDKFLEGETVYGAMYEQLPAFKAIGVPFEVRPVGSSHWYYVNPFTPLTVPRNVSFTLRRVE